MDVLRSKCATLNRGSVFVAFVLLATATLVTWLPSSTQAAPTPQTRSFNCIGNEEYFVVPADVHSISFDMNGADNSQGSGRGARVTGAVAVTPGEELEIKVGCQGIMDTNTTSGAGGYPNGGGGAGYKGGISASGGGGSSSIVADHAGSYEVLAIAGGGGGGTNFNRGGSAEIHGGDAIDGFTSREIMNGKGATQSAGGIAGCNPDNHCGDAGSYLLGGESNFGGGGGGGYYGGGAGTGALTGLDGGAGFYATSGGAGSSYVSPTRSQGLTSPQYSTSDWGPDRGTFNGTIAISWAATATTTTSTTSTTTSTTSTTTSTTSTTTSTTSTTTVPPTTTPPPATTTPPQTTTIGDNTPSWSATPETESNSRLSGTAAFPTTGQGTVMITNEMGFITTAKSRAITPRWRTRFYIGQFSMAIKATYREKGSTKKYSCTFAPFGVTKTVRSTDVWRWYQPRKSCVLPKELFQQLTTGRATLTMTGTFQRQWATNNARIRPDRSRIEPRRVNIRINSQLRTRVL